MFFHFALLCTLIFNSQIALATITACVVPNEQAADVGSCIRYSELRAWLRRSSLHDAHGDLVDDVVVHFRPGTYRLSNSLLVDRSVTGKGRNKLTLVGAGPDKTIFSGAMPISFKPLSETEARRRGLPTTVVYAKLQDAGSAEVPEFTEQRFGKHSPPNLELFYRNVRMQIARWPNSGYATTDSVVVDRVGRSRVTVRGRDLSVYRSEQDLRFAGFFMHDWAQELLQAGDVDDRGRIGFAGEEPSYGVSANRRVWFENALRDVDTPGEWHLDRAGRVVYFLAPGLLRDGDVAISVVANGLDLREAWNVELKDLSLTEFRDTGVFIDKGRFIKVKNIKVWNIGGHGVRVYGEDVSLDQVEVADTGAAGISLTGGDRRSLIGGRLSMRRCVVQRVGRLQKTYAPAVNLYGVGNVVEDSVLRDGPHAAIIFHGNDHLIRRNTIERFVTETDDAGAIYTGQDWTERGTVIEQNIVRHIGGADHSYGANAIYLDDQASGIIVRSNLIHSVKRAVFVGGGRDNIVENNFIGACRDGVYIDARGVVEQARRGAAANERYVRKLEQLNVSVPPYSIRYPALASLKGEELGTPKNNLVVGNVFADCGLLSIKPPAELGITHRESVIASEMPELENLSVEGIPLFLMRIREGARPPRPEMLRTLK